MFGFMKSPGNKVSNPSSSNPFDSDTESDAKRKIGRRTSSEPVLLTPNCKSNPFDDNDDGRRKTVRNKHKKGYSDSEDLDSMSVQELESYAVNRAEDTSKSVNNCLKIAEDIRQDATRTLDTLHQQGEQIHRTHVMATDMDKDLQKGEKLLGNLGGMFSMPWKPKKTRDISGPVISKGSEEMRLRCRPIDLEIIPAFDILLCGSPDEYFKEKKSKEQREKLGLAPAPKGRSASRTPPPEPTNALQQVELEKAKQDDALSDLSDILGDLKGMAVGMGTELNK
ncbi:hypothetical protein C3L33_13671, partial [Rhododendron williamsianum]